MTYAFRLALRELRGGVRGFRIFLACLVLGVGTIAAIGSLGAAIGSAIHDDARLLFGGDVSARLAHLPANAAERQFLDASGTVSEIALLRAMAVSLDGARHTLIELKAVDANYPLVGTVQLQPGLTLRDALACSASECGAVVEDTMLARLSAHVDDVIRIGVANFRVRAVIDFLVDGFTAILLHIPFLIVVFAVAALAYWMHRSWRLAVFVVIAFIAIFVTA